MRTAPGGIIEETVESVVSQREVDSLRLAMATEKRSYVRLAAAAQACTDPKTRGLYHRLALNNLKHVLMLAGLLDSWDDEWLARLDLTPPLAEPSDTAPQTTEAIFQFMSEKDRSQNSSGALAMGTDQEELLGLLEGLRADEEDHLSRLLSLLPGSEADQPAASTWQSAWLRSIDRVVPADRTGTLDSQGIGGT
jgi:rubrerythrin